MAPSLLSSFLLLATIASAVGTKTCYNCGYKCIDVKPGVPCTPEPIDEEGKINFCKDLATMSDMTKLCNGADDCCGSLVLYMEITTEDSKKRTDKVAYHGCEQDLADTIETGVAVVCDGHTNDCYNITKADITGDDIEWAEACFCDTDRCNNKSPDLPDNLPGKTCYDCGYKCVNMTGENCTPQPIDTEGKINFCGNAANMEDHTKQCVGSDQCCGALREYIVITSPETHTVTVDMLTYHGCEKDLAGALGGKIDVICDGHTEACYNVSRDEIHDEFLMDAKACFCEGDRCNKNLPDIPMPEPAPGSQAAPLVTGSVLTLLLTGRLLSLIPRV